MGAAASASRTPLLAQEGESKLLLHGYLTQAYAKADKLPINGINKDGTWNYRVMALQVRYNLTDDDQFVVQTRNRRLGLGPVNDEDVVLDWAYYSHKFGNFKWGTTTVRVGRVPLSIGLYNEMRLVGTVLPFFRAPSVFYLPGIEQIDGINVIHRLPLGEWSLETNPYWGGETTVTPYFLPNGTPAVLKVRSDNIYGVQEWINTPLPGLRLGAAFHHFKAPNIGTFADTTANSMFAGSLDGTFERFFLRGEYMKYVVKKVLPGHIDYGVTNYYGHGGVKLLEPLWLNVQAEFSKNDLSGLRYMNTDDRAVGLSYVFDPNLVLKLEGHAAKGYTFDVYRAPPSPPGKTHYGIASLSVSF